MEPQDVVDLFNEHIGGGWTVDDLDDGRYVVSIDDKAAATAYMEGDLLFLESCVVLPEARGQGLARLLTEIRIEWGLTLGATEAMAWSWDNGTRHNSKRVLESLGFREQKYLRRAWAGRHCVRCAPDGCWCGAFVMTKKLQV